MKIRAVSRIMLTLLLTSMLTLAFNIQPFRASGTIYFRADGSVDPPTTPTSTADNITYEGEHDVAVLDAGPARMRIPDPFFGMIMPVVAAARNQGPGTETFNVSIFYDTTLIGMSTVTLFRGSINYTVSFRWDLETLPKGAYTISANASVLPGETDTADNYFVNGEVRKTFNGDVNADGIVDAYDLFDLSKAYKSTTPSVDVNSDGIVNYTDYGLALIAYGSKLGYLNWNPYADVDNSGLVDGDDMLAVGFAVGWVTGSPNWNPYADMNADNKIDALDFFNLSKNYGKPV